MQATLVDHFCWMNSLHNLPQALKHPRSLKSPWLRPQLCSHELVHVGGHVRKLNWCQVIDVSLVYLGGDLTTQFIIWEVIADEDGPTWH